MRLLYLPNELQDVVLSHLNQKSIGQLCLTCKVGYQLYLPALYRHVELGQRTQIKQLEHGLENNAFLRETAKTSTQILTLKCRQGGSAHLVSLFKQLPNIKQLHFRDFLALSINKVRQLVFILPRLTLLDFQYCELISSDNLITDTGSNDFEFEFSDDDDHDNGNSNNRNEDGSSSSSSSSNVINVENATIKNDNRNNNINNNNNNINNNSHNNKKNKKKITYHPHLKTLQLTWTDFSRQAIGQLFHTAPNINRILLGANHNRTPTANNIALQLLKKHCLHIQHLSISLQQIKESSLCELVKQYGSRLETLSIRCEGNNTLTTISNYANNIKQLTIRRTHQTDFNNDTMVLVLLQQCRRLNQLEMVSWPIQDVPTVVLDQIRRQPNRMLLEGVKKKTVSLGRQDLQEIRRICID